MDSSQQPPRRRMSLDEEIRQLQAAEAHRTLSLANVKEKGRHIKDRAKPHTKRIVFSAIAMLILLQPVLIYLMSRDDRVLAATGSATVRPDGDSTAGWLLCNNAACGGTAHYTLVDETLDRTNAGNHATIDSDYVNLGTAGTTGETDNYSTQNPTTSGTFLATTQVNVQWRAGTPACQNTCDIVAVNIFINGALQTAQNQTISATTTNYTTTFNGSWAAINDLRIQFVRSRQGSGGSSATHDDDVRLYQAYADVTYSYVKSTPLLALKGYVWEMDDASGDGAGQLAAGNTAVTMRAGERATLRAQIRNTGGPIDAENFGLFYDRNDGLWTKVKSSEKPITSGGNCDTYATGSSGSDAWQCTLVDDPTALVGSNASMAFSPDGVPYISYHNSTDDSMNIASYVGSGGNCDTYITGATGSDAWQCTMIDNQTDEVGQFNTSIAFSPAGIPYVSYQNSTDVSLVVANYVGSGGNCDTYATGSSGSDAWQCTVVDDETATVGWFSSLAFSLTGTPYVSHGNDTPGSSLIVSHFVGSGGNCDTYASGSAGSDAWQCTIVDDQTDAVGLYPSMAFSPLGIPYVSYQNFTDGSAIISSYVGSGGNCDTYATGSSGSDAWQCTVVDDQTGVVGWNTSMAFSPSGVPYISHYNSTDDSLIVSSYVGSGGNCDTYWVGSAGSDAWQCTIVDNQTDLLGQTSTAIAFSPAGTPYLSYENTSDGSAIFASYVGSGGNCDTYATGSSGSDAWQCTVVDDQTDAVGSYNSLAVSATGIPYMSYRNSTDSSLVVAQLYRAGEILISPTYGGSASFSESHTDMSSTTDTSNRDDADCATSGTWNNGKYFLGEEGTGLTIADGTVTPQCTEISFTIDTSQAVPGTTYRFIIATNDSLTPSKAKWRGPVSIDNYPSLTIENDALYTTHQIASKDSLYALPNCTSSSWGCAAINATGDLGWDSDLAMDPTGNAWVTYVDDNDSSLSVARYVGSGGNCDSTGGSDAWQCYKVEDDGSILYGGPAIAFSPTGEAWVAYQEGNPNFNLKIARFVGSGGNCDDTAWQCTTVEATNSVGSEAAIAVTSTGIPWVSYLDNTNGNLRVANYVGSGGNCDNTGGSDAWQCLLVDATDTVGSASSIAFNSSNTPWVSYRDAGANNNLEVAQYVGSGGDCDTVGAGSDAWECTTVDVTDSLAATTSIAFNASDVASVAYSDVTNSNLEIASYVGSGGNCDTVGAGSDAWQCSTVAATRVSTQGAQASLAFDATGNAWIAHRNVANLEVTRFVASGGSCSNTAWQCTTIDTVSDTSGGIGGFSTIAFDLAGNPWVAYYQVPNDDLRIAVFKDSAITPNYAVTSTLSSRNGRTSFGRYALSNGKPSASTSTACTATTNLLGLCGIAQEDGQHDTIDAVANHRPMFQMRARFNNNSVLPTLTWAGESSVAASTSTITLQIYRYGSTNAWETVTTNTTCSASTACVLSGVPSGSLSEYFQTSGSNYWVNIRVIQAAHTSSTTTLKTDALKAIQPQQQMRHGRVFNRDLTDSLDTTNR